MAVDVPRPQVLRALIQEVLVGHAGYEVPHDLGRCVPVQVGLRHAVQEAPEDDGLLTLVREVVEVLDEQQPEQTPDGLRVRLHAGVQVDALKVEALELPERR